MFYVSMEEFLSQISGAQEMDGGADASAGMVDGGLNTDPAAFGHQFDASFSALDSSYEPVPIDLNGDSIVDGYGYDVNGDGKIDYYSYDFNHDGSVDAVMVDTNGDGIPDTIYYDFDGDGLADATLCDSTGNGLMDTLMMGDGLTVHSDVGFTVSNAWEAGMARIQMQTPVQAGPLGLNPTEQSFAQEAVSSETDAPPTARMSPSFGATCIGGSIGCAGCSGVLMGNKIVCKGGTIL